MRRLLVLALLALVAPASGAAHAAEAAPRPPDRASVHDRAGDAPASIDLLSARYSMGKRTATFEVKVRELGDDTFLAFEVWPLNSSWDRLAVYREGGRTVGRVYFVDNEEETTAYLRRCTAVRITWDEQRDEVSATWPRRCMQSSQPGYGPYEFHVFSRVAGVADPPRDTMPVKKLRY